MPNRMGNRLLDRYPAWPTLTGYTKAISAKPARGGRRPTSRPRRPRRKSTASHRRAPITEIEEQPGADAVCTGRRRGCFGDNCSGCHGRGAQGVGYPNLNDDDWIWGGSSKIHKTIAMASATATSRPTRPPCRASVLMALLNRPHPDVADYVRSMACRQVDKEAAERGAATFAEQ